MQNGCIFCFRRFLGCTPRQVLIIVYLLFFSFFFHDLFLFKIQNIIQTALYLCENFALDRILDVDFKTHGNLLKNLILKKLPYFNFFCPIYY